MRALVPTVVRFVLLASFIACLGAAVPDDTAGAVIEAKGGDAPLLLWDVTSSVGDIVASKAPRDSALRELEAQAVGVIAEREPTLKGAKRITVRALYAKQGAAGSIYGSATFGGIERLFELSAEPDSVRDRRGSLEQALGEGRVPSELHLVVSGALPPL